MDFSNVRLRLHGVGPESFRTEPDRIGFCLHGTVWNRTCEKAGPVLDPFRTGSRTVPYKQKAYPVRKSDRIRSGPVPCKHSLKVVGHEANFQERLSLEAWLSAKDQNAGNDHIAIPAVYK